MPKKKQKTEEEVVSSTLEFRMTESFTSFVSRESITIDVADYPELEGMSTDQMKSYIRDNAWDMASPYDWADSLGDALTQMDVVKEKYTNEETEIWFD